MGIDIKNIIYSTIAGFISALAVFLISFDAIALETTKIASTYGWGVDLTYYTTLSLITDYMEIMKGISVIYGSIGNFFIAFLSAHYSEILSANFTSGSPTRFFFTVIFPFLSATLFAGLTSKGIKEYIFSSILAPIVFIVFGFSLNSSIAVQAMINAMKVAGIGIAVAFPIGLILNLIASISFEKKEEEEEREEVLEEIAEEDLEIEEDLEL